jgi:hypothetical protein
MNKSTLASTLGAALVATMLAAPVQASNTHWGVLVSSPVTHGYDHNDRFHHYVSRHYKHHRRSHCAISYRGDNHGYRHNNHHSDRHHTKHGRVALLW